MKRQINLHNRVIKYSVRRSKRAKRLRIAVYQNGQLIITTPNNFNDELVKIYLTKKAKWILSKINIFNKYSQLKKIRYSNKDFEKYKDKAFKLVLDKVNLYNKKLKFEINKITIKNHKTRWGSASIKKNLNFNFRILFLKPEYQDYIIIHELCHLKELNHSRKYWNLISKIKPNYKEIIKNLRIESLQIR